MTFIDHIYACMAAPILMGMLFAGKRRKSVFLFILSGMTACLFSAYINSFFAGAYGADIATATAEITPVVEEIMKLLPLLFYLLVFEPEQDRAQNAMLVIAVSFATFENICWLTENGADQLNFLLLRGFSTGAMHVVCGVLISAGLAYAWRTTWLKVAGTAGLLCSAVTFHAMYNLLLSAGGAVRIIGYLLPIAAALLIFTALKLLRLPKNPE
ncbi:PrsW family glutamic-type intramembrane protease [Acidaminobacterium chupaoyuni]